MRIVSRSRLAGIGAAAVLALTIAPTAMAAKSGTVASGGGKVASTPVSTSGSAKFTSCVAGGSGTAKWAPGSLDLNVAIPSLARQTMNVDARYNTGAGAVRVKSGFALDAGGKAASKLGAAQGVPGTGGPVVIDILNAAGAIVMSTDPAACPVV